MSAQTFLPNPNSPSPIIHILSGTFTSIYLYLLSFNTLTRKLSLVEQIASHGPHQYLTRSEGGKAVYATSWKWPPGLYSWEVEERVTEGEAEGQVGGIGLKYLGSTPITAISSYITLHQSHIYSQGGPTGEIHAIPFDPSSRGDESDFGDDAQPKARRGFGEKVQEMVYVPEGELEGWDKTNKALRYGTHAIEFGGGKAFVPDLGANAIWVHNLLPSGELSVPPVKVTSPRAEDGPRHAVVGRGGVAEGGGKGVVYAVTEHTQFVDVYDITEEGLDYVQSSSLIPKGDDPHDYRGDTIRLSKTTPFVFATTRGKDKSILGLLCAFPLDIATGHLINPSAGPSATYKTPTSGGRANAIEVLAVNGRGATSGREEQDWLVLTDEVEGWIVVVSWDGKEFREVDRLRLPEGDGASHAIWMEGDLSAGIL